MPALNILLSLLVDRGVITQEDSGAITSLYVLTALCEGKLRSIANEEERIYLDKVLGHVEAQDFNKVRDVLVPRSLRAFHIRMLRALPNMTKSIKRDS